MTPVTPDTTPTPAVDTGPSRAEIINNQIKEKFDSIKADLGGAWDKIKEQSVDKRPKPLLFGTQMLSGGLNLVKSSWKTAGELYEPTPIIRTKAEKYFKEARAREKVRVETHRKDIVDRNFLYRGTRSVLQSILGTRRLINRVEKGKEGDEQIGRYVSRWRLTSEKGNTTGYLSREEMQGLKGMYQKAVLAFKDLTGIYRDSDFVLFDAYQNKEGYKELARRSTEAGLTQSFNRLLASNQKGRGELNRAWNEEISGKETNRFSRAWRSGAFLHGISTGIRFAATGGAIAGLDSVMTSRLLSMTFSPVVSSGLMYKDMSYKHGAEVAKRMLPTIGISAGLSGFLTYGAGMNFVNNLFSDLPIIDLTKEIAADSTEAQLVDMTTAWTARYLTTGIIGTALNTTGAIYAQRNIDYGSRRARFGSALGLGFSASAISAQAATLWGGIRLAGEFTGDGSTIARVVDNGVPRGEQSPLTEGQSADPEFIADLSTILRQDVATGNELALGTSGVPLFIERDGIRIPIQHPSDSFGFVRGMMGDQPNNPAGNLISSIGENLNSVDGNTLVVDFDGRGPGGYVEVSVVPLSDSGIQSITEITNDSTYSSSGVLLRVPQGDSNISILYSADGRPVGYEFSDGMRLIRSPEGVFTRLDDTGEFSWNPADIEDYVNSGQVAPNSPETPVTPEPTGIPGSQGQGETPPPVPESFNQEVPIREGNVNIEITPVSNTITETIPTEAVTTTVQSNWSDDSAVQAWARLAGSEGSTGFNERIAAVEIANALDNNPALLERLGADVPGGLSERGQIAANLRIAERVLQSSGEYVNVQNGSVTGTQALNSLINSGNANLGVINPADNPYSGVVNSIAAAEQGGQITTSIPVTQTRVISPFSVDQGFNLIDTESGQIIPGATVSAIQGNATTNMGGTTVSLAGANYITVPNQGSFVQLNDGRIFRFSVNPDVRPVPGSPNTVEFFRSYGDTVPGEGGTGVGGGGVVPTSSNNQLQTVAQANAAAGITGPEGNVLDKLDDWVSDEYKGPFKNLMEGGVDVAKGLGNVAEAGATSIYETGRDFAYNGDPALQFLALGLLGYAAYGTVRNQNPIGKRVRRPLNVVPLIPTTEEYEIIKAKRVPLRMELESYQAELKNIKSRSNLTAAEQAELNGYRAVPGAPGTLPPADQARFAVLTDKLKKYLSKGSDWTQVRKMVKDKKKEIKTQKAA